MSGAADPAPAEGLAALTLPAYDQALTTGNATAVTSAVHTLLDTGINPVQVLTGVIAAGQRAVGIHWQRGEWTVAQEHAATALAVAATEVVTERVRGSVPITHGSVLVACAEREWHALPAMIISCALRAHGWDSTLLGASTTPMRLNRALQDVGPEALAVSCSVLGSLPAGRHFIEAGTAAGVPVVVGGSAFGPDDLRARALGATAWARDAQEAVTAVAGLPTVVPPAPRLPAAAAAEQAALELDHQRLVAVLRRRWSLTASGGAELKAAREVADDALHQVLHAVWAVLLTGDPRPISETTIWVADVLHSRGAEGELVDELGQVVATSLGDFPLARGLVERYFAGGQPIS
ncbi:cobalamin B12-binding domain-containing protein [Mycolicibacterium mengxianglii]|uniref:cobalamin B12-binding domain-containing protein n=1 Tax=Mycolicibacterium mengxianglii TaxID=2736649 RepID=UPI0018D0EB22|nr:cobalamin-dependent protein [Mycolicibacterium mengxianglii]